MEVILFFGWRRVIITTNAGFGDMTYFAITLVVLFVGILVLYFLAEFIPFLRPAYCRVLPWHSPRPENTGFDGCSVHAKCRWCGYEGMIDSQGNLF